MDVRVGLWRRLSTEELMLLNCDVGEDLRVPWTAKRSNQSILKEISPRCSMEGMMLKLKLQYFGHLRHKSWLIRKDSDAGRGWGQEEKRTTEDEMAGWPHRFNRGEFEWTPGVGDGQGGLACCNSWGHKELDMTEQLNWTDRESYISILFKVTITKHQSLWNHRWYLLLHAVLNSHPEVSVEKIWSYGGC